MGADSVYRWDIVVPAQRYVFAVEEGVIVEFDRPEESPAERFVRYQGLKADHPVHGMIAWPNTVLLRGPVTAVVDPGLITQGPPLLLGLERLGVSAGDVELVINTHSHVDHTHANVYFPRAAGVLHAVEHERYAAEYRLGFEPSVLHLLQGDEGEIAPGLRFMLTPGHTDGSICVFADTAAGLVVFAGDTVGPLPRYFEEMTLPVGFPGRDQLLRSWARIRAQKPTVVVPGHNPPVEIAAG